MKMTELDYADTVWDYIEYEDVPEVEAGDFVTYSLLEIAKEEPEDKGAVDVLRRTED